MICFDEIGKLFSTAAGDIVISGICCDVASSVVVVSSFSFANTTDRAVVNVISRGDVVTWRSDQVAGEAAAEGGNAVSVVPLSSLSILSVVVVASPIDVAGNVVGVVDIDCCAKITGPLILRR